MLRGRPTVIALTAAIFSFCAIPPDRVAAETGSQNETALSAAAMYAVSRTDGTLYRYDFSECQLKSVGVIRSSAGVALTGIEAAAYIPGFQNLYCFWTDPVDGQNKLVYVNTETAEAAVMADDLEGGLIAGAVASAPAASTSLAFDGIDDFIVLPHIDSYLLDSGTVTLEFKVKTTTGRQGLFSKDSSGYDTGGHMHIYLDGADVKVRLQSTTQSHYVTSSAPITAGTWYRLAVTFGPAGLRLYIDGVQMGQNTYTGGLGTTSGGAGNYEPIVLGAGQWASGNLVADYLQDYFAGEIRGLQVIDHVVPQNELGAVSDGVETAWTVYAVQHALVTPPVEITGLININPNNSPQNEFQLVNDADGTNITRDDLHQDSPVDGDGDYYEGGATMIRVKPKGNGNQNGLMVNGEAFPLKNSNTYVFNGDMTARIYNDHIHSNGKAMGKWWIEIDGTIVPDDEVELPDRLIAVDHKTGVVTEIMALSQGYDSLATVDGQVFYATVGADVYRLDPTTETETLLGAVGGADLQATEFFLSELWSFDLVADNLRACDTGNGTALDAVQVGATDLGTIVFVPLPADPVNDVDGFD